MDISAWAEWSILTQAYATQTSGITVKLTMTDFENELNSLTLL